jgi:uncharacterized membrane protein
MTEPTPPVTAAPNNRAVMIVLAYLWLLALVPLLVEKTDPDLQWHAKHGIVLTIAEIVALMAWSFLVSLVWIVTGPVGCVFYLFSPLLFLAILVLHVAAILKGINGQRLVIPHISDYANRF